MRMLKSVPVMCESHVGSNSHGQQLLRSGKYATNCCHSTQPVASRPSSCPVKMWMTIRVTWQQLIRTKMNGCVQCLPWWHGSGYMMNLSCQRICRFVAILLTVSFEICTFWYYLFIPRPHLDQRLLSMHPPRQEATTSKGPASSCAQMIKYVVV